MKQVAADDKLQFRSKLEPVEQPENEELVSTLKRLAIYYRDRANSAGKHAREATDQQSLAERAVTASRWEAKLDAIIKVAENLGVEMEGE